MDVIYPQSQPTGDNNSENIEQQQQQQELSMLPNEISYTVSENFVNTKVRWRGTGNPEFTERALTKQDRGEL